jgi:REP element-mobilizing transposase RayT
MPIAPRVPVSALMQSVKRFTARQANQMPARAGQPFWQDESYGQLVRNRTEFERVVSYIEMNPVAAGMVASRDLFPWSGAWPIDNRPAGSQSAPHA